MTEQKLYAFHAQDKLSNPTTAEMKNRDPTGPLFLTNCDQRPVWDPEGLSSNAEGSSNYH